MNIKRNVGRLIGAGTTALMVVALSQGIAQADPPAGTYRTIALAGSDTTEEVIQAVAEDATALAVGGTQQVASYNATGSTPVQTGPAAGCSVARTTLNGSGNGKTALLNAMNPASATFGCLQGARSSSGPSSTATYGLTYIPFATENVTFAVTAASSISLDQTLVNVQNFYKCAGGATAFKAMLPQSGSGTRNYWIDKMYGGSNSGVVPTTFSGIGCIQDGLDEAGLTIQEHRGTQVNKNNEISVYSVAQWTSQTAGVISNFRGTTRLGQIGKFNPFGATFPVQRDLYNVFPTYQVADATDTSTIATNIRTLFKGDTSAMCTSALVLRYGLTKAATCGSITNVSTGPPPPTPTP